MAGQADAGGVDAPGEVAAEFAGGAGRAYGCEGGLAVVGLLAEHTHCVGYQAYVGDALAKEVLHHRGCALDAAGDDAALAALVGEHIAVEVGDDVVAAPDDLVCPAHFFGRGLVGEWGVGVVKDLGISAVGYECGGGDEVAVGG